MTPTQVLLKAKALISDEKHWIKGRLKTKSIDGGDCFCATGALSQAGEGSAMYLGPARPETLLASTFLQLAVAEWSSPRTSSIVAFNDRSATTHAEVLHVFDTAIVKAEEYDRAVKRYRSEP